MRYLKDVKDPCFWKLNLTLHSYSLGPEIRYTKELPKYYAVYTLTHTPFQNTEERKWAYFGKHMALISTT